MAARRGFTGIRRARVLFDSPMVGFARCSNPHEGWLQRANLIPYLILFFLPNDAWP
jgi:hypothetical protein